LDARFLGFEHIKELYRDDSDFANVYNACQTSAFGKFYRLDGYLFKESHLCVPLSCMHELFVREAHGGGLMGHLGVVKTLNVLHEHFYCPKMRKDDVDQPRNTSKEPLHVPNGPITRSKTKALKEALNALVLNVSTKSELKGPLEY
jgi:hypothetical protein